MVARRASNFSMGITGRRDANTRGNFQAAVLLGVAVLLAGALLAQSAPEKQQKQLVVNGAPVGAAVLQVNGHYYLDVETVAQITSGELAIEPTRIVLTLPNPAAAGATATASSAAPAQSSSVLSRAFASAGITTLEEMREWQGTLETMVTYGLAVDAQWAQGNYDRVQTSVAQASVAATTAADRDALRLLNNQFAGLTRWAGGISADRQDLNGERTVDPNRLQNDSALTKISACGSYLNSMFASGVYADNANCE